MSLIHSPRIVTDGLKLVLDAGVPTSWNAGISTNWTDKVGGNNGTLVGGTYHNDGPFVGAGYVDLNSSGDYLSIADSADLELDTNTTIELFIKFNTIPTVATYIFGKTNGYWLAYDSTAVGGVADRFTFAIFTGSSWSGATNASGGFLPVVNTWYHIAVVKEGTSTKLYVDGTLYGSGTFSGTPADNSNVVSINYSGGTIDADISNVRFIRGTALYTSNFTPPTKPLTAVTNTKLLTCQGNSISDASSSAHSISVTGNAAANLGYPASAFEFDGSNDYVQVPNSSALQLGTGDFTIEMWWYMIGSGNCRGFTLGDAYDANGMELYLGSSGTSLNVYIENATRITADSVPSFDTWHHYVIERTSGTMKLYIDGVVQSGTYSSSQSLGTGTDGDLRIGVEYYNGGLSFVGDCKISNFKIYKGKGFTATEVLQNYNALKRRYA